MTTTLWVSLVCLVLGSAAMGQSPPSVLESARDIPIAYQVDVVVVGGSTGAVSAAVAAAKKGAKVFLAAPRPYLGEDMCATLRLWLEEGEAPATPLSKRIFASQPEASSFGKGLAFTYEADKPSVAVHKDTSPPSRLCDGEWGRPETQSVQYDGDVTITADLGASRSIQKVHVLAHERKGDFEVASVTVSVSGDGKQWREAAAIQNKDPGKGGDDQIVGLSAPVTQSARYVKFLVRKADAAKRVLLAEIVIEGEQPAASAPAARQRLTTPMQVKKALDDALLESGVQFLFCCYATDVLYDAEGKPCGIVMANRAGRQAVVAKAIIDATDRASVARMAGAKSYPWPAGIQTLRRVVVGGEVRTGKDISGRKLSWTSAGADGKPAAGRTTFARRHGGIEYTLKLPMKDGGFPSWAAAEQLARDLTFDPNQVDESEVLFQVPPDPVKGRKTGPAQWAGVEKLEMDVFRPSGVERVYVLSGCADVPREQAEKLVRPLALMDTGDRIGAAAAEEAKSLPAPKAPKLPGGPCQPAAAGDVREALVGLRPMQELPKLPQEQRALPVIGKYDVVVIGGGTSGAPAGIGAARQGAKTLVVEYLHGLGGVSTVGLIGKYYFGFREGFTAEVDKGVKEIVPGSVVAKMEWYRSELRKAGADIWFGALGCGGFVDKDRVVGVVVATPEGRGVVLARTVIDATGNSDVAAAAGAACVYQDGTEIAVQGTGLPPRQPGANYTNTDYTFADEADMVGVWSLFVYAREKFKSAYDLGQLIDTRERRRIVGDHVLSPLDEVNQRTYPDSVVYCYSNFDSHGYTVHPLFYLDMPPHKGLYTYVPYRCLLPKGLDGILVVGLGVSAHRDAVPVIRMQPDLQNEGYAAGVAASMAAKAAKSTRQIDIKELQKHLVKIGSLPGNVLTDKDSYPIPTEKVAEAVKTAKDKYKGVSVILACPEQALPLVQKAYGEAASPQERLTYAHILGMMGDGAGLPDLLAAVEGMTWDKGWNFKGMGQFGWSVSQLDSLLIALGKTRDRRALAVIMEKAKELDATSEFSHVRAVALAAEAIGDPAAAGPLAELLKKPRMSGHAIVSPDKATAGTEATTRPGVPAEKISMKYEDRNSALRELVLARALYRCGDKDGLGKRILTEYEKDIRGHFATHARAVLQSAPK